MTALEPSEEKVAHAAARTRPWGRVEEHIEAVAWGVEDNMVVGPHAWDASDAADSHTNSARSVEDTEASWAPCEVESKAGSQHGASSEGECQCMSHHAASEEVAWA